MSACAVALMGILTFGCLPNETPGRSDQENVQRHSSVRTKLLDAFYGTRSLLRELDLHGDWRGVWCSEDNVPYRASLNSNGNLCGKRAGELIGFDVAVFTDEKNCNFHIKCEGSLILGIYDLHDRWVMLCFGEVDKDRPTTFRGGEGQNLIILHRVKPRK